MKNGAASGLVTKMRLVFAIDLLASLVVWRVEMISESATHQMHETSLNTQFVLAGFKPELTNFQSRVATISDSDFADIHGHAALKLLA